MGANYKASRPCDGFLCDREASWTIRRSQDRERLFQRRNLKDGSEVSRLEQAAEERRRVHQLQLRRSLHRPTAYQEQGSQTTGVELLDFGNIEDEHTDSAHLLNPAPQLVERTSSYHASRAVHDRYILQAFDLKFEFHMSVHTNLPGKRFPDSLVHE